MAKLKQVVNTKDGKGAEIKLAVISPTNKIRQDAQNIYNQTFSMAVKNGAIFRKRLHLAMEEQGLWNFDKEEKYKQIMEGLADGEGKLAKGGITKAEAR